MLKKLPKQPQIQMFQTVLTSFINLDHELCLLAKKIDWDYLEKEFAPVKRSVQYFALVPLSVASRYALFFRHLADVLFYRIPSPCLPFS